PRDRGRAVFVLVPRGLAELADALAHPTHDLGDAAGAEEHHHDGQDDEQLWGTECRHGRYDSFACEVRLRWDAPGADLPGPLEHLPRLGVVRSPRLVAWRAAGRS